jgi:hypothetical protein
MDKKKHDEAVIARPIAGKVVARMKRRLRAKVVSLADGGHMSSRASACTEEPAAWQRKGATLSDMTARDEFGLTQDEIVRAIRCGELQYREGSMYGNPWLRLLRREVEALFRKKHGGYPF